MILFCDTSALIKLLIDEPGSELAAAYTLHTTTAQPLSFACFDRRLNQAALILKLEVLP